jgi:hypothetical protein
MFKIMGFLPVTIFLTSIMIRLLGMQLEHRSLNYGIISKARVKQDRSLERRVDYAPLRFLKFISINSIAP